MIDEAHLLERLGIIETELRFIRENTAQQGWVREIISPLRDGQAQLNHAVSALTEKTGKLADETTHLYAAHDKFLDEESKRRQQKHEEEINAIKQRTMGSIFRNWVIPICAGVITLATSLPYIVAIVKELIRYASSVN